MINKPSLTQNQQAIAFGIGLVFFVCVLISLVSLGWWLSQKLIDQEQSPVNTIVISGEMPYTQREEVLSALSDINLANFFQVNVNDIQAKVSGLPWVYSVAVRKQWPNELKIYVVDQTPIALWNGDFILNQFGKAFQAEKSVIKKAIPAFFGPEGSELLALENYTNLNDLLDYSNLMIDELILSERYSWQLILNNGIRLNLGREERVKRVQRFMDVYPLINRHLAAQEKRQKNDKKQLKQAVDYIDLRYDTGLSVGWKEVDETSPNNEEKNQQKLGNITMLPKYVLPNYKLLHGIDNRHKLSLKELALHV